MPVLACDVGGTRLKVGIVVGATVVGRLDLPADAGRGLAAALRRVAREVPALCRRAGVGVGDLGGLGLAFPGIIAPGTERILSTPAGKFDDAAGLDVARTVERLLGLRTRVCNDANAALAGEWRHGAARGCRSVVMMTLGTGIGTSAIVDGVALRGQHGQAGCLGGHMTVNLGGRTCPCGNVGCAETEASTWVLPELARAHPGYGASRLADAPVLDFAAVFRAAADGDRVARELRDRSIRAWATALVTLIHAYDPECAVIGGGIMREGTVILRGFRRQVREHAWTPWGRVRLRAARLGNDAGMIGVAALVGGDL